MALEADRLANETFQEGLPWIETYTGRRFYVTRPRAQDVCLEDIAHSLALQCRFTGHVREFYSIAQHSVLVSHICAPEDALWGLLHDASEAYYADMSRPLKHSPGMKAYRDLEKHGLMIVAEHFGLVGEEPASVKQADVRLLVSERRDLLRGDQTWRSTDGVEPVAGPIVPWCPRAAEQAFLRRYEELTRALPAALCQADGYAEAPIGL
jgi:uncharacterized protein